MIVVDTSAVMAVLLGESGSEAIRTLLAGPADRCMGAPTRLELSMVVFGRSGHSGLHHLNAWIAEVDIEEVEFTDRHREIAVVAFDRYGKGRHRSKLNFGDCMSYAIAAELDAPLLFVGNDFTHTDIESALPAAE